MHAGMIIYTEALGCPTTALLEIILRMVKKPKKMAIKTKPEEQAGLGMSA